jgi:predicted  nucleic acid-binding Zn-ribbon protein
METKEQIDILLEICRQDLKLTANRDRLNRLGRESEIAKVAATDLESKLQNLNTHKAELLKNRKALDEKLQVEKANLRKWEARAEKIKGEREYTALMSEISAQKRTISGLEAEINEVTTDLKTSDADLLKVSGAREEKIDMAGQAFESVKELLGEESQKLSANTQARQALLDKLPATIKSRYERIAEKRAQQGVALLKNAICQACMRMVPPELYIRVLKAEVIEQCPSCQRILVADIPPAESKEG